MREGIHEAALAVTACHTGIKPVAILTVSF
jgi:hypothetical protein